MVPLYRSTKWCNPETWIAWLHKILKSLKIFNQLFSTCLLNAGISKTIVNFFISETNIYIWKKRMSWMSKLRKELLIFCNRFGWEQRNYLVCTMCGANTAIFIWIRFSHCSIFSTTKSSCHNILLIFMIYGLLMQTFWYKIPHFFLKIIHCLWRDSASFFSLAYCMYVMWIVNDNDKESDNWSITWYLVYPLLSAAWEKNQIYKNTKERKYNKKVMMMMMMIRMQIP